MVLDTPCTDARRSFMTLRKAVHRGQAKTQRSHCKGVTNPTDVRCAV